MGINFNAGNDLTVTVHGDQNISEVHNELDKFGLKESVKQEIIERAEKEKDKSKLLDFLETVVPSGIASRVLDSLVKNGIIK